MNRFFLLTFLFCLVFLGISYSQDILVIDCSSNKIQDSRQDGTEIMIFDIPESVINFHKKRKLSYRSNSKITSKKLNNLVSGYFDFAENMALEEMPVKMQDYIDYLNNLIKAGKDKLLTDSGSVKHEDAIKKAKSEYKKYQKKTLSQIEVDYIESLKEVSKEILKKKKDK